MKSTKEKHPINRDWFENRMREVGLSQRQAAAAMYMDPSTMNNTLKGERAIKPHEYARFADVLQVPITEVLQNAGIAVPETMHVPIAGYLGADSTLTLEEPKEYVTGPSDLPEGTICILCRTALSRLAPMDGWLLFTGPPTDISDHALGRLCLVWHRDSDEVTIAHVKRGYRPGTFNLHPLFGDALENVKLARFSPVSWLKS